MVDGRTLGGSLLHGAIVFAAVLVAYGLARWQAIPDSESAALAFTSLVAGNVGLILLYRRGDSLQDTLRQRNPAFWIVVVFAMGVLTVVTWLPPAEWFGFAAPSLAAWLLALALPLALVAMMKASKG